MKRFFKLACMAVVAIVASVTVASCSKSDDEGNGGGSNFPSALCYVYGFTENIFDNYDLQFTYTDENGKTVTEDITKAKATERKDTLDPHTNETYTCYLWKKTIIFNKSLTSGQAYVTATKKASYAITDDGKFSLGIALGRGTAKTNVNDVRAEVKYFLNKNLAGNRFDQYVQKRLLVPKNTTYAVGSDGTITFTYNGTE